MTSISYAPVFVTDAANVASVAGTCMDSVDDATYHSHRRLYSLDILNISYTHKISLLFGFELDKKIYLYLRYDNVLCTVLV